MLGLDYKGEASPAWIDSNTQRLIDIIKSYGGLPDTPEANENPIGYLLSQCEPPKRYQKKRWTHPDNPYSHE